MSYNFMLINSTSFLRKFLRDQKGGLALVAGLAVLTVVLAAGVAVDFIRGSVQRKELDSALDAAALAVAAASTTDTEQLEDMVQKYLAMNYNGLGFSSDDLEVSVQVSDDTVTISAQQSMPTTLMKVASIDTMTIASYAEVTRSSPKTELVLVLDNTGSMYWDGKLDALKEAASELTETLFGEDTDSDTLKMAIVPFSTTVNVGSQYTSAEWLDHNGLNDISHLNFIDSSKHNSWAWAQLTNMDWNGCVEQRRVGTGIDYDIDDTTPDTSNADTLFPIYFAPDEPNDSNRASQQSGYGSGFDNSYLDDCINFQQAQHGARYASAALREICQHLRFGRRAWRGLQHRSYYAAHGYEADDRRRSREHGGGRLYEYRRGHWLGTAGIVLRRPLHRGGRLHGR
jgi:Flp pilus assembly protein TadG